MKAKWKRFEKTVQTTLQERNQLQREWETKQQQAWRKEMLRMWNIVAKEQFDFLLREQAKQSAHLDRLIRDLARESEGSILEKLHDDQPLVRWLAAHAVARKRLPLEDKMIDLLSDSYPQVRQAAREALVRLSRGNDFGPAPTATDQQVRQASQAWRHWLRHQDPPGSILETPSSPAPPKGDGRK